MTRSLRSEDLVLLGRIPDAELASLTNVPRRVVEMKREELDVTPYIRPAQERLGEVDQVIKNVSSSVSHPLIDEARKVVGAMSGLIFDDLAEDLISVAIVALLEGKNPLVEVTSFELQEWRYRRFAGHLPLV